MFNSHDEEHAGSLGEFEVRRLMKYMGTLDCQKYGGLPAIFRQKLPQGEVLNENSPHIVD